MPAELSDGQYRQIEYAAGAVADRLYADGYHGVVGVDAIVAPTRRSTRCWRSMPG